MPSPIGHALAGVAVAWSADLADGGRRSAALVATCAGLAMLPDADLVVPDTHRTATHSIAAAVLVTIVAAVVTGQVTRRQGRPTQLGRDVEPWRIALLCGGAYATHLLLDWLGADYFSPRGIQLLWPFTGRWYISDLDVFRQTARQHFLTAPIIRQNIIAVLQELAILVPIVAVLDTVRRHRLPSDEKG